MFYPQSVCLCDQHSGAGAALGRSTFRRFEVLISSSHRPHCHEGKGNRKYLMIKQKMSNQQFLFKLDCHE